MGKHLVQGVQDPYLPRRDPFPDKLMSTKLCPKLTATKAMPTVAAEIDKVRRSHRAIFYCRSASRRLTTTECIELGKPSVDRKTSPEKPHGMGDTTFCPAVLVWSLARVLQVPDVFGLLPLLSRLRSDLLQLRLENNLSPISTIGNSRQHLSSSARLHSNLINDTHPPERVSNERDANTIYLASVRDSAVLVV